MAEKPPSFVVVDKRKFTSEGTIREGYVAPEPETPRIPAPEPAAPSYAAEVPAAKVVTMPPRTPEAVEDRTSAFPYGSDDLGEEDMAGTIAPALSSRSALSSGSAEAGGLDREFGGGLGGDLDGDDDLLFREGEEGLDGAPSGSRSPEETAAQDAAYRRSSRELDAMLKQANPGMQTPGEVTFEHVIQSFYLSGVMAMGAGTEPGQKPRIDILGARQSIDMLGLLAEKTRGNLSAQEGQLLQGITFELRMMFLELTNAISAQAQGGPAQGGAGRGPGRGPLPPGAGLR